MLLTVGNLITTPIELRRKQQTKAERAYGDER
jgi:hypothetical protein